MREELDDTPDDMLDAAPQRADRGEVFCHPERVEHAMRMMWRSQLRGRGRNIMLARQRNEERVARALRFGAPETAAVAAVAHPSTTGAHRTAGASSARVEEVLRTNIRKPGAGVIEAFEKTGYLASAQQQLDLGYTWYRTHFFASLQNPAIARYASRPDFHRAMLTDPACDPAAIHRDRLMIESLLAQAPSRDDAFSMSGAPTRAYMDYWHIVYLYLCDDRVRDALWGDTRRAYHLQERFREIVWKYKHPWAIAYHGRGVVQVINTKIAAACRKPLVVLPRYVVP